MSSIVEARLSSIDSTEFLFVVRILDLQGLVVILLLNDMLHSIVEARLGKELVDVFESQTTGLWEEEVL